MSLYTVNPQWQEAVISCSTSGDNTIVAAVANKSIQVHRIFFVVAGDVNIILKNGSTALTGLITLKTGGSFVLDAQQDPWFRTTDGSAFILNLSGVVQASGRVYYKTI